MMYHTDFSRSISDIRQGSQILISVKYRGTVVVYNNGLYMKSRRRTIDKTDYLLGDNYYYPIRKVLGDKLKFGYYKFTCCDDKTIYMDIGADHIDGTYANESIGINVDKKWKEALSSKNPSEEIIKLLGVDGKNIDKLLLRTDDETYIVEHVCDVDKSKQSINSHMLTIDMVSNMSVGTLQNLLPQQNRDELLIKAAVELLMDYVNSTSYNISDIFSDLPTYLRNDYYKEKAEEIGDYRFISLVDSNKSYYDVFCFMLSLIKRGKLIQNPLIKMNHVRKFSAVTKRIADLCVQPS